jgi:hypothetical protein
MYIGTRHATNPYSPFGFISNTEVAQMAKKPLKKSKKLSSTKTLRFQKY